MVDLSVTHRNLLLGTIAAATVTSVFYLMDGNWAWAISNNQLPIAIFSALYAVAIALIPYATLVMLLRRGDRSRAFQIVSFLLVVGLPICALIYWRTNAVATGGWDYFIVPIWQLGLEGLLYFVCIMFVDSPSPEK
jgi:hypothetical protein